MLNGLISLIDKLNWSEYVLTKYNIFFPNWAIFIINGFLFYLVIKILYWLFKNAFLALASKTQTELDDIIISALETPLLGSILVLFVIGELHLLNLNTSVYDIIFRIGIAIIIVLATVFLYKLIGILDEYLFKKIAKKTESDIDDQLFPLIRKTLRVVLVIVSGIYVLNWFGVNIAPLLTGVGIGGLALAFAAQKTLGNIFGGIAIFTDKPFKVGDVVQTPDTVGTVLEVGLRSTRIKTFDGTVMVIPNEKISTQPLENISLREARKVKMKIGLTYDTSNAKLKKAKKIIEDILKKTKRISENYYISFSEFGDSALILDVIYWVDAQFYSDFIVIKDKVNSKIKEKFEKEGIEFAYPTQTIYLKK